jgi:hypothetical protein
VKKNKDIQKIPLWSLIARLITLFSLSLVYPRVIIDKKKILPKIDREAKEGRGFVLVYTHFSYRDGIELTTSLVINNPVLRTREVISPLSFHQNNVIVRLLTDMYHEKLYPIVNNDTLIRKGFEHLQKGQGMDKFINASAEAMKRGGIVMIATNAGRRERLDINDAQKPLGYFMLGMQKKNLKNYGILIVSMSIEGAKSYNKKETGGLNIGKKYITKIVDFYHPDELLANPEVAGKISNVDTFIRRQIAKVSPKEYLPENYSTL